jgi:tRNA-dihydrouridine synthase
LVQEVAEHLTIPVLGSGDVVDRSTAEERLQGKVAGLFIGRASIWNPLVFGEIVSGERDTLRNNHAKMLEVLFRYIELLREDFHDSSCAGKLKQLASQMCRGATWRKPLLTLNTLDQQIELLQRVRDGAFVPGAESAEQVAAMRDEDIAA